MKAVILCGGRGTRIRDVSEVLPKPMLPIGNMPILWHIMKLYSHYGVRDFILCLGYKGWVIKEFFLNYYAKTKDMTVNLSKHKSTVSIHHKESDEDLDWNITLAETGEDSQTGARIWNILRYLDDDENFFSVTYGDGIGDVDIKALTKMHVKNGLAGMVTAVRPSGRFGEIEISGKVVSEFNEKTNVSAGMINGGFMIFDKKALKKYLTPKKNSVLEIDVLPAIVKDKQLGVYQHDGFWQCIDTPRELDMVNELWNSPNPPWRVW